MAQVTKSLANIAKIEKQIKAMIFEIGLQKTARVKTQTQLTAVLEQGQTDARQTGGENKGGDRSVDGMNSFHSIRTDA